MPSYGIVFGGGGANLDLNKYTASSADILEGKTAITHQSEDPVNPTTVIGNMPNRGTLARVVNAGEHVPIPYGFYGNGSYVLGRSLAEQTIGNANEWEISNGKVAWVNGLRIVGKLPEKGSEQWGNVFEGFNDNAYYCIGNMPIGIYRPAAGGHLPRLFVGANEVNNAMGNLSHKIIAGNRIGNVWGTGPNFQGERTVFNGATFDQNIVSGVAIADRVLRIINTNTGGGPLNSGGDIILHQSPVTYANKLETEAPAGTNIYIESKDKYSINEDGTRVKLKYSAVRRSSITHVGNAYKIYDKIEFFNAGYKTRDYYDCLSEYLAKNRLILPLAHSVNVRHLNRIDVDTELKVSMIHKERIEGSHDYDTRTYFVITLSLEPLSVRGNDITRVQYPFGNHNILNAGTRLGPITLMNTIKAPGYYNHVFVHEFDAYDRVYTNHDNTRVPIKLSLDCTNINDQCYIYISFGTLDVGVGGLHIAGSELYVKNIKFSIK